MSLLLLRPLPTPLTYHSATIPSLKVRAFASWCKEPGGPTAVSRKLETILNVDLVMQLPATRIAIRSRNAHGFPRVVQWSKVCRIAWIYVDAYHVGQMISFICIVSEETLTYVFRAVRFVIRPFITSVVLHEYTLTYIFRPINVVRLYTWKNTLMYVFRANWCVNLPLLTFSKHTLASRKIC